MDNGIFFSIIVPVYNVEPYLQKCVDSVLSQTFQNFELILVDDGSSDHSPQMCDEYAKRDLRVKVIHKRNGGSSSARNVGMRIAKGSYISFLDSDDFWLHAKVLENIHKEIETEKADVIVLKSKRYFQETDTFSETYNPFAQKDFSSDDYETRLLELVAAQVYRANAWNKVFLRELMDKQDLYFTEGIIGEDIDWAARLCIAAKSITVLAEVVHGYRYGRPGSVTSSLKLKNLVDTKESIERCIQYVDNKTVSEKFKYAYYSYVAYRYVIWMAESAALKDREKTNLIKEMRKHSWLLNYDGMQRVKLVKFVYKILGFRITSCLLGIYLKNRTI